MLFGVNDLQIIIFAGMNNKSVIFFTKCFAPFETPEPEL